MTLGESRRRIARELLIGLLVFGLYSLVQMMHGPARQRAADRHGRDLFDLERRLHLDIEPGLNRWLAPHDFLRTLANYEYAITYVVAAGIMLVWLYARRPDRYREMRNSFVVLNVLGIATFWLYPVAPPRLLAGTHFIDTVREGHTWGSWGSPLVTHANQLAAMPSLHVAWALWVSVVLAELKHTRTVQAVSLVHVGVTLFVIMATANHFLLDAAGGAVVVWLGFLMARRRVKNEVKAPDAFFLHVENDQAPQHVGGLAVVDTSAVPFTRDALAATVRAHLDELPRFRQRLRFRGRWRRPVWVEAADLDWNWHVPERDLTRPDGSPGGFAALHELVAELAAEPLPRDRPMWRFVAATGVEADRAAGILVVHHVIADGVGTVAQALNMLEPRYTPRIPAQRMPGPLKRAAATAVGLAQLATDGFPKLKLPTGNAPARGFTTVDLPLDGVREIARRHGARVSDVLLTVVAGALSTAVPSAPRGLLRVSVPLMVRAPDAAAEGNLTAAVMTEVPLGPVENGEVARLAEITRRSRGLYTGTRTLAANFAMRAVGAILPVPGHAWFARTVYGGAMFQAIVSNMPGPDVPLSLAGPPLAGVYPILPLAPRVPIAVGALGWDGMLSVGVATDPALIPDAAPLGDAMKVVFGELTAATSAHPPAPVVETRGVV
ncbi:phosphatase PAP2 family protein [Actinoplanes sp. NPDC051411]|uniref:bifunctional phosphatase PAP2/O-acyltransferase family protein n=1 Tax=Actinoplanes sp. NPDC051411 TaxID=3155522 RepID=UPI003429674C